MTTKRTVHDERGTPYTVTVYEPEGKPATVDSVRKRLWEEVTRAFAWSFDAGISIPEAMLPKTLAELDRLQQAWSDQQAFEGRRELLAEIRRLQLQVATVETERNELRATNQQLVDVGHRKSEMARITEADNRKLQQEMQALRDYQAAVSDTDRTPSESGGKLPPLTALWWDEKCRELLRAAGDDGLKVDTGGRLVKRGVEVLGAMIRALATIVDEAHAMAGSSDTDRNPIDAADVSWSPIGKLQVRGGVLYNAGRVPVARPVQRSLRDEFAMAVVTGLLSYSHVCPQKGNWQENASPLDVAEGAYQYADAMLKAGGHEQPAQPVSGKGAD